MSDAASTGASARNLLNPVTLPPHCALPYTPLQKEPHAIAPHLHCRPPCHTPRSPRRRSHPRQLRRPPHHLLQRRLLPHRLRRRRLLCPHHPRKSTPALRLPLPGTNPIRSPLDQNHP